MHSEQDRRADWRWGREHGAYSKTTPSPITSNTVQTEPGPLRQSIKEPSELTPSEVAIKTVELFSN